MSVLENIHQLDLTTFDWCLQRKRRDIALQIARPISHSADGYLYAVAGVIALVLQAWTFATLLAVGFALERLIYFVCKNSFKRNRPAKAITGFRSVIQASDEFSFPSGHTSGAFFMACSASLFEPVLGIIFFPWAALVGASRVMLGVHFPTDCFAGALLGTSVCLSVSHYLSGV